MIHYTLLPKDEIKILKKEYRMRLAIFSLFFISCAVLIGICSLIPAFLFSSSEEKQAVTRLESIKKNRKENGIEVVVKELKRDGDTIKKIKSYEQTTAFSNIILQIIYHRNPGISVNSFQFANSSNMASSTQSTIIQGKSSTRESLIIFKNRLESDPVISNVDLPVSDLAKSKDISFSIRLSIRLPTK